jgi:hypothetical protein
MPDLRPSITSALAAFGLPATVTIPGEEPVVTTAIWLSPVSVDTPGVLQPTNTPQPSLAIPRAGLKAGPVPRGTLIEAAEYTGGPVLPWIVEAILGMTADEVRVVVIPDVE